jgi:hypothetical protein
VRRVRDEQGWALVTALVLMTVMLGVGLAALSFVDRQQVAGAEERRGESRFNVTEAVLNAQAFQLSRNWPRDTTTAFAGCADVPLDGAGLADRRCTVPTTLRAELDDGEATGATFSTRISDNVGANALYYDPANVPAPTDAAATLLAQDRGGPDGATTPDGQIWVEASTRLGGRTRRIVGLVRVAQRPVSFPSRALVAGRLGIDPNGNKVVINTQGDASQPTGVALRCSPSEADCLTDGLRDDRKTQMFPNAIDPQPYPNDPVLSQESLDALRDAAESAGTYYESCPPSLPTAGNVVVYIKQGPCVYGASETAHTVEQPGVLVVEDGSVTFRGNYTYNGTVYARNRSGSRDYLVNLLGSARINGAVLIDGMAGFYVHDMGALLIYNTNVNRERLVAGEGNVVRSTWRELPSP